jgi:hypothetical protein
VPVAFVFAAAVFVAAFVALSGVSLALWYLGAGATVVLLVAIGFRAGRLRAVGWALVVVLSAVLSDEMWWNSVEPFDRSEVEGEAQAVTPYVVIGLPVLMLLIALGVAARALTRRRQPESS